MRRSKLELYLDILSVLSKNGPLKLTHVMYKANVNASVLGDFLDFLLKQNLIETRLVGRQRRVYAITQKGIDIVKGWRTLKYGLLCEL